MYSCVVVGSRYVEARKGCQICLSSCYKCREFTDVGGGDQNLVFSKDCVLF